MFRFRGGLACHAVGTLRAASRPAASRAASRRVASGRPNRAPSRAGREPSRVELRRPNQVAGSNRREQAPSCPNQVAGSNRREPARSCPHQVAGSNRREPARSCPNQVAGSNRREPARSCPIPATSTSPVAKANIGMGNPARCATWAADSCSPLPDHVPTATKPAPRLPYSEPKRPRVSKWQESCLYDLRATQPCCSAVLLSRATQPCCSAVLLSRAAQPLLLSRATQPCYSAARAYSGRATHRFARSPARPEPCAPNSGVPRR